jgi:undecaprenyl-diphosphatase
MEFWHVLVLSVVEGITEFLPISSTGHLVLTSHLLNIPQTQFVKTFEVFIQIGAILAVIFLYFRTLTSSLKVWINIILAFTPTAILGLIFYDVIKEVFLGNILITLVALFLGGILLIFIDKLLPSSGKIDSIEKLTPKKALLIGLAQSVSMIPGVSRAAATIIGGLSLGFTKKAAVEFSFLLAIPTMFAATSLDLIKSEFNFTSVEWQLLALGTLGSFITALVVIKWFLKYVQNHNFVAFGVYRIILALLFWIFFF